MAEDQSQEPSSSLLQRLFNSTNREFSLFLPLILGLSDGPDSPIPDQDSLLEDPAERDRIVVVNPFTQGTVVIEGSSNVDALLRGIREKDGHPPASRAAVEALPEVEEADGACAICLDELVEGGVVKEMPCGHRFHGDCVGKWLGIHGSCPICRHLMPMEGEERDPKRTRREIWVSFSLAGRRRRGDAYSVSMDGGDLQLES